MNGIYHTTELEIAAFLKARGHRLTAARLDGRFVVFEFDPAATADVPTYFSGAETPARELFEAHRSLWAMIQQIKEHKISRNRSENPTNEASFPPLIPPENPKLYFPREAMTGSLSDFARLMAAGTEVP